MKFFDVDKIRDNTGVVNKYALTNAIAQRARQISERKGSRVIENGKIDEKFITQALVDLEGDKVAIALDHREKINSGDVDGDSSEES